MTIGDEVKVNEVLTKSRNPTEHGFRLENQVGELKQILPHDPYRLIKFDNLKIQKKIKVNNKTQWVMDGIYWYLHEDDFY